MNSVLLNQTQQQAARILGPQLCEEIEGFLEKFPADKKRSAVLTALLAAQHENKGFLTTQLMDAVADYLELAKIHVYEVVSFYSMYETKPVARNNVVFCKNVSCMLMGADSLVTHVENKLGIKLGESTQDGRIYLKLEEECLAACVGAPAMQVNHVYYENLTTEKVDEILDALK